MRRRSIPAFFAIALGCGFFSSEPAPAQDVAQLGKDLTDGDREQRREAAYQLRELGAAALPALPALIKALRDDDEQVVGRSVTTIARIGPKAADAVPALIESMNPDRRRYDQQVIFRSAFALSQIGEPAIDPLRQALQSQSDRQREGAARALKLMGSTAAPAIPELIGALHDDEVDVRRSVAEALAAIGQPAVEPLRRDLKNRSSVAAVHAIGLVGIPAAAAGQQLIELLESSGQDESLHWTILLALGSIEIPFEQLKTPLRTGLTDESEKVRRAAASVLLSYPQGETNSLPLLRNWLNDKDGELRTRAVWVIGQFGADAASLAPDLIIRVDQGDDPAALTAALAGLGSAATEPVLQAVAKLPLAELQDNEHWTRKVLRSLELLAMPALKTELASEHASVRFVALDALGAHGELARPMLPDFRRACNDPEAAVRLAALLALESAGADPKRLASILRSRCSDDSAEVRAVAVRLLGKSEDSDLSAVSLVADALADPNPAVRRAAIISLANFGAEAQDSTSKLLELAAGADAQTRLATLTTLASIGRGASAALPLVKTSLADPDPALRGAAIAALVAIEADRESLTGVLSKMLDDKDTAVRHPAIDGLGQLGEMASDAAPELFALLTKDDDRTRALEALRNIRSRDVDLYIVAIENDSPRVRLFACEALGRLGPEAEKAIPQLELAQRDRYDFVRKRASDAIRRIRN